MRAGTRSSTVTWIWFGLAALGAVENLGPRPLFVRTAYAASEVTVVEAGAMHAIQSDTELPLTLTTNHPADR